MKLTEAEVSLFTKWVEALESGKYEQEIGFLKGPKGYCCIGVLCDLVNPLGWAGSAVSSGPYFNFNKEDSSFVPISVAQLLPTLSSNEEWGRLYILNDELNYTLTDISAYLRGKYLT